MTALASVQTAADTAPVNGWLVLAIVVACLILAGCLAVSDRVRDINRLVDEPTAPKRLTDRNTRLPRATHDPLTCDCKDVR